MLARMFCGDLNPSIKDDQGYFLLDRDPKYFQPILNYLRTGKFNLDGNLSRRAVLEEAHYFGIQSLRNLTTPDQNGTSLAMLLQKPPGIKKYIYLFNGDFDTITGNTAYPSDAKESVGNMSTQIREKFKQIGIVPNYISPRRKKWPTSLLRFFEDFIEINFCNEEEATRALKWWNGTNKYLGSYLQARLVFVTTDGCSAKTVGYCVRANHDFKHCKCVNCQEFRRYHGIGEFKC